MARQARLHAPGHLHYLIQESNENLFMQDSDRLFFLAELKHYCRIYRIQIHAFILLPQAFHALLTPEVRDNEKNLPAGDLGEMIKRLGRRYVAYFNAQQHRKGSLWARRYHAGVLHSNYFLAAARLLELSAVRMNLVSDALTYQWSSHPYHVGQAAHEFSSWLQPHPAYLRLANMPFERENAYKKFCTTPLTLQEEKTAEQIYYAARYSWLLGDDKDPHNADFIATITAQAGRRITPGKPGRPFKRS